MIRLATRSDLAQITAIYNEAIDAKFQTAYTEPLQVADRVEWFEGHTERYPVFVYEADGAIAGWISVGPYRGGRNALRYCVELSCFLSSAYQKQGIGSKLIRHALSACKELGYRTAIGILLDRNTASTALMHRCGFELWGHLPGVADFDGEVCGHNYYGFIIS